MCVYDTLIDVLHAAAKQKLRIYTITISAKDFEELAKQYRLPPDTDKDFIVVRGPASLVKVFKLNSTP